MPLLFPTNPSATYALRFVLLALLYAATAWLSLALIPSGSSGAALVWPIAAVGLAGLLFWGLNLWPALVISLFVVLFMTRGYPPDIAATVAVSDTLEALLGAYILMRAGFHPMMSRLRDALGLILAAFVASFASATLVAIASAFLLHGQLFNGALWVGFWIGHLVSILSFGPFVVRWGYRPLFTKTRAELLEGSILFGLITLVDYLASWTAFKSVGPISLIYVLVLLLIWTSLRAGPRGTGLALLITTVVTISGALYGHTSTGPESLLALQTLLGVLSIIFLLFTSITEERKEAVIALEGHVGKLEDALERISQEDKAKGEFIAILAHELRNPLSPVLSGLEILKTRDQGPADVLHMMGAHLHTLARLLDDLLDITRISQKKFKLEYEIITLQDIITRSLEMAQPYLASKGHSFTLHMPAEPVVIHADPVRLEQVFVNLLNNAAKYTPQGGTISLVLAHEGGSGVVRIKDNGQGIAHERLQEVFEAFAGVAARSQGPGGLHIGLSLARRMVELHRGNITVHSGGVDQGSEFIVRLPLPEEPLVVATPSVAPQSRGRFSKEAMSAHAQAAGPVRLLVVDDNEAAAQLLCTLLEHNGHRTSVAYSGLSALDVASRERPEVALVDIGLPDIDGYEVAKRLREKFGLGLGLIALTGYGQQGDREKSRDAGFDNHLVKPISIVDVERALAGLKRT